MFLFMIFEINWCFLQIYYLNVLSSAVKNKNTYT